MMTINSPRITINGFKKIYENTEKSIAIGIAGTISEHGYVEAVEGSSTLDEALASVHVFLGKTHSEVDRASALLSNQVMENQGIATYFDTKCGEFISNLYTFIPSFYGSWLYSSSQGGARLVHVGSGSPVLQDAVSLESINAFLSSLKADADPVTCLEWISMAYQKVSEKATGCGAAFDAVVATRQAPKFRVLALAANS